MSFRRHCHHHHCHHRHHRHHHRRGHRHHRHRRRWRRRGGLHQRFANVTVCCLFVCYSLFVVVTAVVVVLVL